MNSVEHVEQKQLEQKPLVFADHGEEAVAFLLEAYGCRVVRKKLEVSDFVVAEDVGVERKKHDDFVRSIMDGRLFDQLANLKRNFKRPLLIVEGKPVPQGLVHENTVRGAFISTALDFRVPMIFTADEEDTAQFLALAAKREQQVVREFGVTAKRKPLSTSEAQLFILSSLPGVGLQTAKRLLQKFRTVERVFRATEKQLRGVDKIGEKKARRIKQMLSAEYSADE